MALLTDLVPFIPDQSVSLILATVRSVEWTPSSAQPGWEDGVLTFQVDERFTGTAPVPGETITVVGRRHADPETRLRMGFDAWNVLPFEPGRRFLLAVRQSVPGSAWGALAAQVVPPGDTALVDALRRALQIERDSDPASRRNGYQQALGSHQDLLFRYAVHALTVRQQLPRDAATALVAQAVLSPSATPNERFQMLQGAMKRPLYDDDLGADAPNRQLIATAGQTLAVEADPEWALVWAQLLTASLVPSLAPDPARDREIREALIGAVPQPARQRVPAALLAAAAQSPADARLPRLAEMWTAALR